MPPRSGIVDPNCVWPIYRCEMDCGGGGGGRSFFAERPYGPLFLAKLDRFILYFFIVRARLGWVDDCGSWCGTGSRRVWFVMLAVSLCFGRYNIEPWNICCVRTYEQMRGATAVLGCGWMANFYNLDRPSIPGS